MRWRTAALAAGWANVLMKMRALLPVSNDKRSVLRAVAGGTGYGVPVFRRETPLASATSSSTPPADEGNIACPASSSAPASRKEVKPIGDLGETLVVTPATSPTVVFPSLGVTRQVDVKPTYLSNPQNAVSSQCAGSQRSAARDAMDDPNRSLVTNGHSYFSLCFFATPS